MNKYTHHLSRDHAYDRTLNSNVIFKKEYKEI